MSKDVAVMILGVAVAALPFLGFPSLWEMGILVVVGLTISFLMYLVRQDARRLRYENGEAVSDGYVESGVTPGRDVQGVKSEANGESEKK